MDKQKGDNMKTTIKGIKLEISNTYTEAQQKMIAVAVISAEGGLLIGMLIGILMERGIGLW